MIVFIDHHFEYILKESLMIFYSKIYYNLVDPPDGSSLALNLTYWKMCQNSWEYNIPFIFDECNGKKCLGGEILMIAFGDK